MPRIVGLSGNRVFGIDLYASSDLLPTARNKTRDARIRATNAAADDQHPPRRWQMIGPSALALVLAADGGFPLAAAFALPDGGVVVADLESRHVTPVNTAGLLFSSVDIAPNKRTLIGTAHLDTASVDKLYRLANDTPKEWSTVTLGGPSGQPRTPRFTPSGRFIVFAASQGTASEQRSPTQLWRQPLTTSNSSNSARSHKITSDSDCHFSPSALDDQQTAEVSTNCISDFRISVARGDGSSKKLARTTAPYDEVAASFDGRTIVVSRRLDGEQVFELRRGDDVRRIYSFRVSEPGPVQPKFVCPRDLMFLENGTPRVLNTQDGGVETVEVTQK